MGKTTLALALCAAAVLAGCGGGGSGSSAGDQTPRNRFSAQVSFGDSLADVGTYAVGGVAAAGGGKYTINGNNTALDPALTGKNWTELLAAQLGLPAPCAAQTGLDGDPARGFSVPVANHPGCFSYAQGGARVSNPVGPGNKLTGSPVGLLTVPVVTQVANHLARAGGRFAGTEVVFVTAGGNDAFSLLDGLGAGALAAGRAAGEARFAAALAGLLAAGARDPLGAALAIGAALKSEAARPGHTDLSLVQAAVAAAASQSGNGAVAQETVFGPLVARAQAEAAEAAEAAGADYQTRNGSGLVAAMGAAGAELAALVRGELLGKGANFVVVNSVPDIAISPPALAAPPATMALLKAMVSAFNDQLRGGVAGDARVAYVDLYAFTHDQAVNPAPYGLTNVSMPACAPGTGSSLFCTAATLAAGDVSHYLFADDAHPTPFENTLVARYVAQQMIVKGWL